MGKDIKHIKNKRGKFIIFGTPRGSPEFISANKGVKRISQAKAGAAPGMRLTRETIITFSENGKSYNWPEALKPKDKKPGLPPGVVKGVGQMSQSKYWLNEIFRLPIIKLN